MEAKLILKEIAKTFHINSDKYLAHTKIMAHFEELCNDTKFIHEAIKDCISKPNFFKSADNLFFHLLVEVVVIISINLFTPIYDKAKDITQDNIHHHGWRLLLFLVKVMIPLILLKEVTNSLMEVKLISKLKKILLILLVSQDFLILNRPMSFFIQNLHVQH